MAVLAASLAMAMAVSHPLSPFVATAFTACWIGLAARFPRAWLTVLPALLPVASLAPWSGWVAFEEFDLLVLGAVAGGHFRFVRSGRPDSANPSRGEKMLLGLVLAWTLLGLGRGWTQAGPPLFGWFHGQADALNAWRVGKSTLFALALFPMLRCAVAGDPQAMFRRVAAGMTMAAATLCLLVLWERAAFPGLLDWSLPYRTTAWFWDMHVGGAAIDAYMALLTPFVVWALWAARSWLHWLAAAALAVAWAYACLTTYARGAYLGAAVGLFVLGLRLPADDGRRLGRALRLGMVVAGTVVPVWMAIDAAGYGAGLAVLAGAGILLVWRGHRQAAANDGLSKRALAAGALTLVLLFEAAAVVGPDSYMWTRLNTSGRDGVGRFTHWRHGLGLIHGTFDWVKGIGLGRLPTHYDRRWPMEQFSGRAVWQADADGIGRLRLSGPRTYDAIGGLYGITQRVPVTDRYQAALDIRAATPVELLVRVCESHLLYDRVCQADFVRVEPGVDAKAWQQVSFDLVGPALTVGRVWAPRQAVLTISVTNAGAVAEIARVVLADRDGKSLLRNAGFGAGLARWWPTAQFHFLPWHVDNLYLELLIERGAVGLALFLAVLLAVWRAGKGRHAAPDRPTEGFLLASLAGGLCVGLVSSLVDVPRVAWLLWLMVALLYAVRAGPPLESTPSP